MIVVVGRLALMQTSTAILPIFVYGIATYEDERVTAQPRFVTRVVGNNRDPRRNQEDAVGQSLRKERPNALPPRSVIGM